MPVGAPAAAALPKVKESMLARASATVEISNVRATREYVAWLERGKRGARVAVKSGDRIRRSGWQRKINQLRLHRGVDARTGEVAVRVELGLCRATGRCSLRSTLSPRTLRRSPIRWAAEPEQSNLWSGAPPAAAYWYGDGMGAIVDGTTQLTYRDTPEDPPARGGDLDYVAGMRPTGCDVRFVEQPGVIPVLHDCGNMSVYLRNELLAVRADIPSQTTDDHYSTHRRLDVLDLRAPAAGWRRVGSESYGKGGTMGTQSICLLDDGIAVLSGTTETYSPSPAGTWRLAVIPLRDGGASWQAATPQLVEAEYGSLTCTARDIYAVTTKTRKLVRLVRPKGAPAAGSIVD
ncbi:MAG: hypothetical protein J7513_05905 [Solirubrobacteraceae bacterium]|nr:hypothetical protein [Solirubrobacteraceae bacterium]